MTQPKFSDPFLPPPPPPQAVNSDLSLLRGSRGQTSPDELNLKIV